ncbi:MAG: hypothetical protein LBC87_06320 [Fibromonadaceae bacterium]|nr:hypothetical protein [Fibromonadaceae bacterium]
MTDQELKDLVASFAEDRKEIAALQKETDRIIKELSRRMGGVDENIGSHAEQYFQNILMGKLSFAGQKYDKMIANMECCKNGISLIEFDIVLVNGKSVAIIETKHRIHPKFVKELAEERLPKFRELWPEYSKHKIYLGIAGFSFNQKVLEEAEKYGICVLRQVGDSVEIKTNKLRVY